jgi:hypothetical protein
VAALGSAVLTISPVAHADSADDAFLHELNAMGVPVAADNTGNDAIRIGKKACELRLSGHSDPQTINSVTALVEAHSDRDPDLIANVMAKIIAAGELIYCPSVLP